VTLSLPFPFARSQKVKHLLVLREQLVPFDIEFAAIEKRLDFNSTRGNDETKNRGHGRKGEGRAGQGE
jgi:hypothetical protein